MTLQSFDSIWDAIEDTPEAARNMRMRSHLMMVVQNYIVEAGLTQSAAAKFFGVTQPRISDLMRGRITLFSLDMLVTLASRCATIELSVTPREIPPPSQRQRRKGSIAAE
jgi:predicted XRE-type DNA-binding protein